MRTRRSSPWYGLSLLLTAGLALLGTGCAGGPDVTNAPRHGVIVYFNPGKTRSRRGLQTSASALMYVSVKGVTDAAGSDTPLGMEAFSGSRDPNRRPDLAGNLQDKRIHQPKDLQNTVPVSLGEEEFASLWATLEETGLCSLPTYPGTEPPTDKAYFVLDDRSTRRIFARPEGAMTPLTLEHLKAWTRATQVILTGSYSDNLYHSTPMSSIR